ncbi:MAG: GAF domain-containing protein [Candidatus Falkowbacteria bacterium]
MMEQTLPSLFTDVNIPQKIAEIFAAMMDFERCVIFRIIFNPNEMKCQLIAKTPLDEHELNKVYLLEEHLDHLAVFNSGEVIHVTNPEYNPLTSYFAEIIRRKNINEILLLPVVIREQVRGIIALDAVNDQAFTAEDIYACSCFARYISITFDRDVIIESAIRDELLNPLNILSVALRKLLKVVESVLSIVKDAIERLDRFTDKQSKNRL